MYLYFMSFLHVDKTQVVEIPPRVRQGHAHSTKSISWLLMSWRRKEIINVAEKDSLYKHCLFGLRVHFSCLLTNSFVDIQLLSL